MREGVVQKTVWLAVGQLMRLFRVNTAGKAWIGSKIKRHRGGAITIYDARPISVGLTRIDGSPMTGTTDLVGFTPVVITARMVGHTLPVFSVLEAKHSDGGDRRPGQEAFIETVLAAGGIGGFFSSVEDVEQIQRDFYARFEQ